MHEASLVRTLIRRVETVAREHAAAGVERVRAELGPLSGVEPVLVDLAWRQLAPATICQDAELVLEQVPLSCRCFVCKLDFRVADVRFECPKCGSDSIQVTGGDEFRLLDVTIRERISEEGRVG